MWWGRIVKWVDVSDKSVALLSALAHIFVNNCLRNYGSVSAKRLNVTVSPQDCQQLSFT